MSRHSARTRSTLRWGAMIAALLAAQSLLIAGLFWLGATGGRHREVERRFAADCAGIAALPVDARAPAIRRMIREDVHRDRFLALFDMRGDRIDGNVAHIPAELVPGAPSTLVTVRPTEMPGKTNDQARSTLCALSGHQQLLTGVDLDDDERMTRTIGRALLIGLLPALTAAVAVGLAVARRAARQVDTLRTLSQRVVAGDLNGRLAVSPHPDSFGLLCAHINTMLDRIETLMGEVRGVGDDIAHQIRTPLTRLRARLEREREGAAGPAAFRAAADGALVDIDRVLAIVAALLRIRELEDHARRSRFAPVDLARIVADAADLHAPSAEDQGVTLVHRIDTAVTVNGDASLLMEAVSNLIDNAIKFGPPHGHVEVALSRVKGQVRLAVSDDGEGVPPAERDLVVQRFYRGRHDAAGCGLGLSLVKAIADLHGFALRFAAPESAVSLIVLDSHQQ